MEFSEDEWVDPDQDSPVQRYSLEEDADDSELHVGSEQDGVGNVTAPSLEAFSQPVREQHASAQWGCFKMVTTGNCDKDI